MTVARVSVVLWLVLLALFAPLAAESSGNRAEFGRVLESMPPNGPFWRYGTVTLRRTSRKAGMKPAVFPHWAHRGRYSCRVCHLELGFAMRSGDTRINRADYLAGKYCGACHNGETAFTVREGEQSACDRCHLKDTAPLEARFDAVAPHLPLANFGNGIDWSEALRSDLIRPVPSILDPRLSLPFPDKLSQPLPVGSSRSDVLFSHQEHSVELDCSSCHPDIFTIKRKGTEDFSMERNMYGNFCGACHMRVAFPMSDCRRCHSRMSAW